MTEQNKQMVQLSMLDPIIECNVPHFVEKPIRGKDWISYGEDNRFPEYLLSIYNEVPTLQAIVNASVDFATGDSIELNVPNFQNGIINSKGDTVESLVKHLLMDKYIFGGYAFQVIRNFGGEVSELYYVDFSKLRSSKDTSSAQGSVYMCDDWGAYAAKGCQYPKYEEGLGNSIVYEKGEYTRGTYPAPVYGAALTSCEIERQISKYHLNNLTNGFASSAIIAFCNGLPDDEQKGEIERGINDKFAGSDNAGRIMITYADSKDTAPVVQQLETTDWADKYQALTTRTTEQIFLAFGLNPVAIGLEPDKTGWAKVEYAEAYKLYMETRVNKIRQEIIRSFEKVFGVGALKINDKVKPVNNESTVNQS